MSCMITIVLCMSVFLVVSMKNELIDKDTSALTIQRHLDSAKLHLVMSDEFNTENRRFDSGRDKLFEALNKPDFTNDAIQFYNSSTEYVTTRGGSLVIRTTAEKAQWSEWSVDANREVQKSRNYSSGMVQSWNKFCFTGGVLEMSIQLPGEANSGGLWPAAWLMGNLARAGHEASSMYVWPWSYDKCGEVAHLASKQEINACNGNPGSGLNPHQGRGSPEIDIFEVMPGHHMPPHNKLIGPFMSSTLQVSPGVPKSLNRPVNGQRLNSSQVWYDGLVVGNHSETNHMFWGTPVGPAQDSSREQVHKYMEDGISANTNLRESHFTKHHVYRLEWQPGPEGYLYWYLDGEMLLGIPGKSLQDLTGAMIPVEPMYLILNTAISHNWGMPEPCPKDSCGACWVCYDCHNPECQCSLPDGMKGCRSFPAEMKIDYIRVYQDLNDSSHTVSCSPDNYPTAEFIKAHYDRYADWKPATQPKIQWSRIVLPLIALLCGLSFVLLWANRQYLRRQRHNYISL